MKYTFTAAFTLMTFAGSALAANVTVNANLPAPPPPPGIKLTVPAPPPLPQPPGVRIDSGVPTTPAPKHVKKHKGNRGKHKGHYKQKNH